MRPWSPQALAGRGVPPTEPLRSPNSSSQPEQGANRSCRASRSPSRRQDRQPGHQTPQSLPSRQRHRRRRPRSSPSPPGDVASRLLHPATSTPNRRDARESRAPRRPAAELLDRAPPGSSDLQPHVARGRTSATTSSRRRGSYSAPWATNTSTPPKGLESAGITRCRARRPREPPPPPPPPPPPRPGRRRAGARWSSSRRPKVGLRSPGGHGKSTRVHVGPTPDEAQIADPVAVDHLHGEGAERLADVPPRHGRPGQPDPVAGRLRHGPLRPQERSGHKCCVDRP